MHTIFAPKENHLVALPKNHSRLLLVLLLSALILPSSGCGVKAESSTSVPVMSNLLGLIGLSSEDADSILGEPFKTEETPIQESVPKLPSGGERRDYEYEGYDISLLFDKEEKVSKAVFVWGGLATQEYMLDDATGLLDTLGVHVSSAADFATDEGVTWYDYNGFQIYMALGHKTGEHQYARGGTHIDRVYIAQLP